MKDVPALSELYARAEGRSRDTRSQADFEREFDALAAKGDAWKRAQEE